MIKSKVIIKSVLAFTVSIFSFSCGTDLGVMMSQYKIAEDIKKTISDPVTINMPSVNYNQRPSNTKIDTIVIHHTAPFASLTRVGYYFQDINTRVSAHYTVGKEGLIIQSVDEKDRAWHAGPSSWIGKYNLNDFSIGIEILNDGNGKDPFTPLQYNALNNLVAYLMKKYDVPIENVIGHRDIAFPLGRKSDPADNFDWKMFKSKIRSDLNLKKDFWSADDNPQALNPKVSSIINDLYKDDINVRAKAVDTLLTVPYKSRESDIDALFNNESSPIVRYRYLRLFEIYENKKHTEYAYSILNDYKNNTQILLNQVISYLYFADKANAYEKFYIAYNQPDISPELRMSLIKVLANYKKAEIREIFFKELETTPNPEIAKAIVESLAKYEDKMINPVLINNFDNFTDPIKVIIADTLRATFDEDVEKKMVQVVNNLPSKDVLEAVTWTILRKESKNGIAALTNEAVYKRMDDKLKIGLFNAIAKINLVNYEDFLLSKISTETDNNTKSALFLALGRLKGEKSFPILIRSVGNDPTLNMVLLKALSNYNKKEINSTISEILRDKQYSNNLKIMAISTIRENKLYNLLPVLKAAYVETNNSELNAYADETIKFLEKGN